MKNPNFQLASHKDFHLFELNDQYFIYDIERMNILNINDILFKKISKKKDIDRILKNIPELKENRSYGARRHKKQTITNISLNVAQTCNLRCIYCYAGDGEYGEKGIMTEKIAFEGVDFLMRESGKVEEVTIVFFGGEPLLNFPLIKKVVKYSRLEAIKHNKKIRFSITTNGTLLNDEVIQFINKNNFSVVISFDGTKEIQDRNRPFADGSGSYDSIAPKVKKFLKFRNGRATARATVTEYSAENLDKIKRQLFDMGFNNVKTTVATISDNVASAIHIKRTTTKEFNAIAEQSLKDSKEIIAAIKEKNLTPYLLGSNIVKYIKQLKDRNKSMYTCGVGRRMAAISISGDIYPCHRFVGEDKFNMGNLFNYSPDSRIPYVLNYGANNSIVCKDCWARYHCGGKGCIQDNYIVNGDINSINQVTCIKVIEDLKWSMFIYNALTKEDKRFLFNKL